MFNYRVPVYVQTKSLIVPGTLLVFTCPDSGGTLVTSYITYASSGYGLVKSSWALSTLTAEVPIYANHAWYNYKPYSF